MDATWAPGNARGIFRLTGLVLSVFDSLVSKVPSTSSYYETLRLLTSSYISPQRGTETAQRLVGLLSRCSGSEAGVGSGVVCLMTIYDAVTASVTAVLPKSWRTRLVLTILELKIVDIHAYIPQLRIIYLP